jgi:uncharacterized protein YbcV (DUF1398 family)
MFSLEQIAEIHDRLGDKEKLGDYLRALREIGIESHDSYLTDGHSEYYGTDGQRLSGPPFHEVFTVAETCDKEWFLRYMQRLEDGYVEMSRALAGHGVEKWTFDMAELTITYFDRAGNVLLTETVE